MVGCRDARSYIIFEREKKEGAQYGTEHTALSCRTIFRDVPGTALAPPLTGTDLGARTYPHTGTDSVPAVVRTYLSMVRASQLVEDLCRLPREVSSAGSALAKGCRGRQPWASQCPAETPQDATRYGVSRRIRGRQSGFVFGFATSVDPPQRGRVRPRDRHE